MQPARVGRDWQVAGRFEHVFTHFRMQATLWAPVGDDTGWAILPARERQRWVSAAEAEGAPLPAPILRCVRTLLA